MATKKSKSPCLLALNPRQRAFVENYMEHFNARRAYIQAGYSKNGADQSASRMLRITKVSAAIHEQMQLIGITPERIRSGFAAIAFGDDASKIVTGVNPHREQDRARALSELARVEGMITEKQQVAHTGAVNVVFDETDPKKLLEKAQAATVAKRAEE